MADLTLYEQLAESIGIKGSEIIPEMFAMIADEDEAKFVLAAAPPGTVEEIAQKAGIPLEKAEKMVRPLFLKGLLFKSKKPGETRYYKIRNYVQFHDGTVLSPDIPEGYLALLREFEKTLVKDMQEGRDQAGYTPFMRVVPINVTVDAKTQVLAMDDVEKMIQEANVIAVTACSCRTIHPVTEVPLEVCMQLDKAAVYAIDRGTGRELSKEQAMEMLHMCEKEGLVHCVINTQSLGYMICNCDNQSCSNWPGDKKYAKTFAAPSRFLAVVDSENCSACDACIDRCYFYAISMGGKGDTAQVDEDRCMGCGLCAVTCPEDAITMKEVRKIETIPAG
ncbi:MAG: 4Fe-4S binding protein [Proteobacteria bacterium]|nr:4Fe-4S binding protein [Pseudomonadota bacterium]MBU4470607.1 4Fe-4S binding protein [Pseudomonadota bacterium]MCG2753332.1 4Fe-4S binding protein [Desulfobacteraceae bacterium]